MTCQWRITATHGEKIVLNITQIDIPESADCYMDYLEVRDGHWLNSALLGKLTESWLNTKYNIALYVGRKLAPGLATFIDKLARKLHSDGMTYFEQRKCKKLSELGI